jgi:hypothetical protein
MGIRQAHAEDHSKIIQLPLENTPGRLYLLL